MKNILVGALSVFSTFTFAHSAFAVCGDNNLEPAEECDDGNITSGDGCSNLCVVEESFACETVTFTVQHNESLTGGTAPNWVVDADERGISETTNSVATVFSTNMPAQIGEITFDMRVNRSGDDDFLGWTIGYDAGEMSSTTTPPDTDYLYWSWKQLRQSSGGMREAGMIVSRVTGPANDGAYWRGRDGNITQVAEANNFGLGSAVDESSGWDDFRWYRVNMVVTPGRVRVWMREGNTSNSGNPADRGFAPLDRVANLEFDLRIDIPAGNFGFYAQSQQDLRYELIGPVSDSVCSPDQDEDGIKDLSDLDSDRDGILDADEMPGFLDDPDADEDLDGVPDWNDPDHVPGGCVAAGSQCATLPTALDVDGDGIPNHLDRDSDGDGITDAREAGLTDDDGDGRPDACTTVTDRGVCIAGGLMEPATNTDGGAPDFLDPDSDGDGLSDLSEAYDTDGNGMANLSPTGSDTDGDGIDDAFDPDCVLATCGGTLGQPVLGVLTPAQDSDLDGVPDWQTTCGDAYVRGGEACDDGNNVNADMCTNACLRTDTIGCTANGQCASNACDGSLMSCQPCVDDTAAGTDRGCSAGVPACVTIGMVNSCVECTGDVQCGGSEICIANTCVSCTDDVAGNGLDTGCRAEAPVCDVSGASPVCRVCLDDSAGGSDTGCGDAAPVCDATSGNGVCLVCEDNAGGTMMDFGCSAAGAPVCLDPIGAAPPLCVECAGDADCPAMGEVCGPDNTCVPGCNEASDCEGTALAICDIAGRVCVECLDDSACNGDEVCGLGTCGLPDSDMDGIADDVDLDDDNDGILDSEEGSGTDYSQDSDGDGWPDYKDPESVTCDDDNDDGACDVLPMIVDFDGDGVPNHLDLDADGDGIADIIEGGGEDADGNGRVDGFSDGDRNGVDDELDMTPLPVPNTDMSGGKDFLDLDSDDDGLTDTFEAGGTDDDGDGRPDVATDDNFDGWADELDGADVLPLTDSDGDDTPDYRDIDSDGDGVSDGVEGHLGTAASGDDADMDGIDDAFDPDCVDEACGGLIGIIAPVPNTDESGQPDFRDVDSDGDGIADGVECPMDPTCSDVDLDGTPDFRSLDADGDGLPDATEGHDTDHDGIPDIEAVGVDSDGDGLDDAFDADCSEAVPCGGVVGLEAPTPDLDMNDIPDFQDPDDDGDGKPTAEEIQDAIDYEGPAADPTNIDGDSVVNWFDEDSDGDGAPDMMENSGDGDLNADGLLDYLDPGFAPTDSDGDGIIDFEECGGDPADGCVDSDMDGVPDYLDADDDNDGIPTAIEYAADDFGDGDPANDHDADDDGVPNHLDLDADNDGIPDLWENGGRSFDSDGNGRVDDMTDADMDGIASAFDTDDNDADVRTTSTPVDTDGTGQADYLDLDADGDGLTDIFEADGTDADGDGTVDDTTDANSDGWSDSVAATPWALPDTDADGELDFQDVDSDGDGKSDALEATDDNGDGVADVMPAGVDMNGNGIDDAFDTAVGGTAPTRPDQDADGIADWRDADDDGDGVPTVLEVDGDTDMDGTPDYLDTDDDGDGVPTAEENPDPNGDGVLDDAQDTDSDGTPDYLDADDDGDGINTIDEMADPNGDGDVSDALDSDGDGIPDYLDPAQSSSGGLSGGAACSASPGSDGSSTAWLLLGLCFLRRRRRS
ncbi:MAG: DUF4215 domain-containing protein [Polyangiales bacterium]